MPRPIPCGIDFGTSNSALAVVQDGAVSLVEVDGPHATIPTAVFFNLEEKRPAFGRGAIDEYLDGYTGRLLRSLKSILGTSLISETTQVGVTRMGFRDIIGLFLAHIKTVAEHSTGAVLENLVLGRPVFFVDNNAEADRRAEMELRTAAQDRGFRNVSFEFEPIAAARDYETTLTQEELVLVVDIGGGTSDFSLIRLAPERRNKDDRSADILGNSGIHIGGTDFDRSFSLQTIMPEMGYKTKLKNGLDMPISTYHTLATWHLINSLYTPKTQSLLRDLHGQTTVPEDFKRLMTVIDHQRGHELASLIEHAKIALSEGARTRLDLGFIEKGWKLPLTQAHLKASAKAEIQKIADMARLTVHQSGGAKPDDIHTIFMTGGTTGLPGFDSAIQAIFPNATLVKGDRFSSVAKGLGISALQRYGTR